MSTTTDRTQRMIFLALPFFFVIFIINFPAGLLVYWITTNLWTIVQQAIIRKRLGPMRPPGQEGMGLGDLFGSRGSGSGSGAPAAAAAGGGNGNPPKGKPSGPPPAPPRRKKKRSGRRR
jgi:YidC/Oxa1 family membrane protein insertase